MDKSKKIAQLNDTLRTTFLAQTGRLVFSEGFRALEDEVREKVITKVREFKDFNEDNDPHGEHDFGAIEATEDHPKVFWKIDYYDKELKYASEDPANAGLTTRVLTIMLAEEY